VHHDGKRLVPWATPGSFEKKCEVVAVVGVHFWNWTEMVEIGKAHPQLANIQLLWPFRLHSI
jgi:hypothetical protein